jgi:pyruvate/2-oxoglutarate/acetoin dehydrogenase E1 component
VIDLRALRPLDDKIILASVEKTHRAVIVDEGWRTGSLAAEISALIMEGAFFALDAPVARVCSAEVPIPYARHLEIAASRKWQGSSWRCTGFCGDDRLPHAFAWGRHGRGNPR